IIAASGITAAAASGKLDLFHDILTRTELSEGGDPLPLMKENTSADELSEMEPFITDDTVQFSGDDTLDISTVCLYNDRNTLMMTLAVETQGNITLPLMRSSSPISA
ncbi:MAG: hypothetical protein K6C13_07630, partial [Oscillospiraceae bacterium]|nr:hypothetical protein [Oscillospiraceae bacterium]